MAFLLIPRKYRESNKKPLLGPLALHLNNGTSPERELSIVFPDLSCSTIAQNNTHLHAFWLGGNERHLHGVSNITGRKLGHPCPLSDIRWFRFRPKQRQNWILEYVKPNCKSLGLKESRPHYIKDLRWCHTSLEEASCNRNGRPCAQAKESRVKQTSSFSNHRFISISPQPEGT